MPADPICRLIVNGAECGYRGQGETNKARLEDLFRHQAEHLPHVTHDKGTVTIHPGAGGAPVAPTVRTNPGTNPANPDEPPVIQTNPGTNPS